MSFFFFSLVTLFHLFFPSILLFCFSLFSYVFSSNLLFLLIIHLFSNPLIHTPFFFSSRPSFLCSWFFSSRAFTCYLFLFLSLTSNPFLRLQLCSFLLTFHLTSFVPHRNRWVSEYRQLLKRHQKKKKKTTRETMRERENGGREITEKTNIFSVVSNVNRFKCSYNSQPDVNLLWEKYILIAR